MTSIVLILSIVALISAIGAARQTTRTLCAWQKAMEAMLAELRGRQIPERESPPCPCTCHPLPQAKRSTWPS
jgi:hypothetical protein